MSLHGEQVLLRIYLHSADRAPHAPTYERLLNAARANELAGATVLHGILGAGRRGVIRASTWSLSERVPVIVEIVDSAEKIGRFVNDTLPQHMIGAGGFTTLERAHVMLYRQRTEAMIDAPLELAAATTPLSMLPTIESRDDMKRNDAGVLLRIFIGESDRHEHVPLYEAIVQRARALGLSGATVLRGTEGFGANSVVHKSKLLEMSTDLPIVIEIVDTQDKIESLLPHLETMVREGMITMEDVMILMYRHDPGDGQQAHEM